MARLTPLWQQNGSYPASLDRRLVGALWPSGGVSGMAPTISGGSMNLNVAAGAAVVPDANVYGAAYLCPSDAPEVVAIGAAPPSGQDRIDVVTVYPRDSAVSGTNNDWIYNVVAGTPAASPVAPSVPAGQLAICQVRVVGGSAALSPANLTDLRGISMQQDRFDGAKMYCATQTVIGSGAYGQVLNMSVANPQGYLGGRLALVNNALQALAAGAYSVTAGSMWQSSGAAVGAGQFGTAVYVNGALALSGPLIYSNVASFGASGLAGTLKLAVGDLVTLWAFQSTGGAAGTNTGGPRTWVDLIRQGSG